MIYDVITYNGEAELFEIRYNVLKDFVDEFRVIEFDQTFSGKVKEFKFNQKHPKVKYFPVDYRVWSKYEDLAKSSPNTEYGKGAEHWVREFCQKESIKDCLTDLKDLDQVFIGDCDEIWDPIILNVYPSKPFKLLLHVYSYWLNNRSTESFWGTLFAMYRDIKNECLNELRSKESTMHAYCGWHFTSMGGVDNVKKKLTDSYTEDSYASKPVIDNLENNINNNKDFLGRDFTYSLDESEWPQYLKDNKDRYKHLIKDGNSRADK